MGTRQPIDGGRVPQQGDREDDPFPRPRRHPGRCLHRGRERCDSRPARSVSQPPADPETSGVENFTADLEAAVGHLEAQMEGEPRHRLFAPDCKKWLLKLAFGPKEAKEARETTLAEAS